jgi:hypothetical protein
VLESEWETIAKLERALPILKARDMLDRLKAADWPNMKKQDREKLHRTLFRQAYPAEMEKKQAITFEQLAQMLR